MVNTIISAKHLKNATHSAMITKKSLLAVTVSYLIFHPGIAPPADAMLPVGDSDHRNLYKMQGWIWETRDEDSRIRGSRSSFDTPEHATREQSSQELTYPTTHLLTIDLAFGFPTHPPIGDLAFGFPTHPPIGDLAFGFPTHPPIGDLAFGFPTHPPIGDLAFGFPTHPPIGDLAFGFPTHPPIGDLAFGFPTHPPIGDLAFGFPTHPPIGELAFCFPKRLQA